MCGFQGTRTAKAAALRSGQVGNDGLPDKDEIIETARIVREFTKSEASVMNRRSGSQEGRGLHKPLTEFR